MDMQAIYDAISEQKLIMQRLERNMRQMEDSYSRVSSRLDALEAKPEMSPKDTGERSRRRRTFASYVSDGEQAEDTIKIE